MHCVSFECLRRSKCLWFCNSYSLHSHHTSRKHKDYCKESLYEPISNSISTDCNDEGDMQLDNASQTSYEETEVSTQKNAYKGQFLRNVKVKLLLPSSTIQTIIEHCQELEDINQSHLISKLLEKLQSLGLPEADINTVID